MNKLEIKINNTLPIHWDNLLDSSNSTPYARPEFIHNKVCRYLAIYLENRLIGGIALQIRSYKRLIKYIWIDSGILVNNSLDPKDKIYISNILLKELKRFAFKNFIFIIKFSHWCRVSSTVVFVENAFNVSKHATYEIGLQTDLNVLFNNLSPDNRKKVRRAQRKGLYVKHLHGRMCLQYLNSFHLLHKLTYLKAKLNNPNNLMSIRSEEDIKQLINSFDDDCILSLVFEGDEAIGGNLMLNQKGRLFPYIAGTDVEKCHNSGATNLLFWEIINYGHENKYTMYDMGGVPINPNLDHPSYGVYHFKKSFGGKYCEYYSGSWYAIGLIRSMIQNPRFINKIKGIH